MDTEHDDKIETHRERLPAHDECAHEDATFSRIAPMRLRAVHLSEHLDRAFALAVGVLDELRALRAATQRGADALERIATMPHAPPITMAKTGSTSRVRRSKAPREAAAAAAKQAGVTVDELARQRARAALKRIGLR